MTVPYLLCYLQDSVYSPACLKDQFDVYILKTVTAFYKPFLIRRIAYG